MECTPGVKIPVAGTSGTPGVDRKSLDVVERPRRRYPVAQGGEGFSTDDDPHSVRGPRVGPTHASEFARGFN